MKKVLYAMLALLLVGTLSTRAQAVIGSNEDPQAFSVLELVSNQQGLRLPQLTTAERNTLTNSTEFQAEKQGEALGLVIYNTSTGAMEFWNGTTWVSMKDILVNE